MRTLKAITMAVMAILATAACKKEDPDPGKKQETNQNDIEFKVSASNPTEDGITISVTHNGSDKETYYGFCYSDLETSVANAINRTVAGFTEAGTDLSTVVSTGKTNISVIKDLEQNTSYRYVVFGLNTDGTTYGTPGSCEFTTAKGEVVFGVSVAAADITETGAVAAVTSTGSASDTWYCFYTTDLTSSLETVISDKVKELGSDLSSELKSGNASVTFSGLTKATRYRVVVTGLKSDGTTYGKAAETTFKTSVGEIEYTVNSAWTVTYAGKGTYDGEMMDMISVVATSDDGYIPAIVEVSEFEQMGIKTFSEYMIEQYQSLIDQYVSAGYKVSWKDIMYTATEENIPFSLLTGGQWYGFAIGVDTDGNPTGLYAQSEAFTPEELEASDAYNRWLGSWELKDAAGVVNNIVISIDTPDVTYKMTGYQFGDESDPITLSYNQDGTFNFISNYLGQYNFGEAGVGELCFLGTNGNTVITGEGYTIATATLDSNGTTASAEGQTAELQDGSTITFTGMEYLAIIGSSIYGYDFPVPSLPFTMTKKDASTTAAAVLKVDVRPLRTLSPLKMMTSSSRAIR